MRRVGARLEFLSEFRRCYLTTPAYKSKPHEHVPSDAWAAKLPLCLRVSTCSDEWMAKRFPLSQDRSEAQLRETMLSCLLSRHLSLLSDCRMNLFYVSPPTEQSCMPRYLLALDYS